jgi:hypothetical protein
MTPRVTVYVPCRNYGRYIDKAIESVRAQLLTDWELILVDEGSTDDSLARMRAHAARDPERIRVLAHPEPVGLQRTANEVLAIARGRFLVRLDADDWFDEVALLAMAARLEADPKVGLVYGDYYYTDPDGNVLGREARPRVGQEDVSGMRPPHGACTMVRTRLLKAMGGYAVDVTAQDGWELWFKLTARTEAASLSTPLFYYRQHDRSLSRDAGRLLKARARIFARLAQGQAGGYEPVCLAVLAVREDYPGNPGVPYLEMDGRSLLHRAIDGAAAASRVTDVMISSRSQAVLDHALDHDGIGGPPITRLRETFEAEGDLPVQEVLLDAGRHYEAVRGRAPDVLMFLSIHSTGRRADHLDKAMDVLRVTQADSVVSVQEERSVLFSNGPAGLELLNPGRLSGLAFERETVYRFNGALLGVWWDVLVGAGLLGDKVAHVEMTAAEGARIDLAGETFVGTVDQARRRTRMPETTE